MEAIPFPTYPEQKELNRYNFTVINLIGCEDVRVPKPTHYRIRHRLGLSDTQRMGLTTHVRHTQFDRLLSLRRERLALNNGDDDVGLLRDVWLMATTKCAIDDPHQVWVIPGDGEALLRAWDERVGDVYRSLPEETRPLLVTWKSEGITIDSSVLNGNFQPVAALV